MENFIGHTAAVFMGFFAIMNPIANTPVFLNLTSGDDPDVRRQVARKAMFVTFAIILVFCAAGKFIFELFGITLSAFQIAGGLLVFWVGFHMLQGEHSSATHPTTEDQQKSLQAKLAVAVTPLAMPIMAGPGTIATAMHFASAGGVEEFLITVIAFLLLCVTTYVFFVWGEWLVKYIGDNGIKVVTRMMGLILAVIGVQMLIVGITGAIAAAQVR